MTGSISIRDTIFGNYIAGLIIAIISSTYLFSCLSIVLDNRQVLAIVSSMLAILAGIFISTVTLLPTIDRQSSRSLALIYQLVVGGLGLVNIAVYLSTNHVGTLYSLFFWLVFLSPIFAIYSSRKY